MKELKSLIIDTVIAIGGIFVMFSLLLCGCATQPLKGGKAMTRRGDGIEQTLVQSDNPSQASRQDQETVRTRTYTVPVGSRLESGATNSAAVVVSAPMPVVEREETRAKTELGAAQKDTARELGAKLASLNGSVTTSAAITIGGLALMILPTLVVGNELLILGGVGVAVGGWFLAHRHGKLQGYVDANKNGLDDRLETVKGKE